MKQTSRGSTIHMQPQIPRVQHDYGWDEISFSGNLRLAVEPLRQSGKLALVHRRIASLQGSGNRVQCSM